MAWGGQPLYFPSTATTGHTIQVSNFPCRIADGQLISGTSVDGFAQFFDVSSTGSVVLGSSTPSYVLGCLAGTNTAVISGSGILSFRNGIVVGTTTTTTGTIGMTLHMSFVIQ